MAHKLPFNIPTKSKFRIPKIEGRVGFSFYIGLKEIFIGISLNDVITEKIIRKRFIKVSKAQTRTYGFDLFSQDQETNNED